MGVRIPFPEQLSSQCNSVNGFLAASIFLLCVDVIKTEYAEKNLYSHSMKSFREGKKQFAGHLTSVLFHQISDTIKFCFIKAKSKVVPQTHLLQRNHILFGYVCEISVLL